ncbi:MAG: hypothetical protein U1E36_03335 [Rickettsiales bacterium]
MVSSVTVVMDNGGIAGHMYIKVNVNGAESFYGYYPQHSPSGYGPGEVQDDGERYRNPSSHGATQQLTREIPLTDQQAQSIKDYAESVKANPGTYNAGANNCVDFTNNALNHGGQSLRNAFNDTDTYKGSGAGLYFDTTYDDGSAWAIPYWTGMAAGAAFAINPWAAAAGAALGIALGMISPIVLDLDDDGLELTSLANSRTYFDLDNDLFAEHTGWVKPEDGFLARDLNGNGRIDNQGELFGDNGGTSAYAKLAALDSNHDGKISSADSAFASLRIWQDTNQNGYVDTGELKTLTAAGIKSLNTASTIGSGTNQGNAIAATSTFTRANGTTGNAADVLFQNDNMETWYNGNGTTASRPIDKSTFFLPHSRGYGKLPTWVDAFSQNSVLKTKAISLVDAVDAQLNPQVLQGKIEEIMFMWAHVDKVSATSRGEFIDARKLSFIEKMMDQNFINQLGSPNPNGPQAAKLMEAWDNIFTEIKSRLLIKGPFAEVIPAHYDYISDKIVFHKSLDDTLALVKANIPATVADKFFYWQAIGEAFEGQHTGFGITSAALT